MGVIMRATKARAPDLKTNGKERTHLVLQLKIPIHVAREVETILKASGANSEQHALDLNAQHQLVILLHDPQINPSALSQISLKP